VALSVFWRGSLSHSSHVFFFPRDPLSPLKRLFAVVGLLYWRRPCPMFPRYWYHHCSVIWRCCRPCFFSKPLLWHPIPARFPNFLEKQPLVSFFPLSYLSCYGTLFDAFSLGVDLLLFSFFSTHRPTSIPKLFFGRCFYARLIQLEGSFFSNFLLPVPFPSRLKNVMS